VGVTKSSQSVHAFNINKSRDWWTCVNTQKTIKINAKTVDNHCKYIVVIYTNKTGPNRSWTGSQKICKPQDRGPDFLRTGKTVTVVLPGPVTVRSGPRSFFGSSNRTLKHYSQTLQDNTSLTTCTLQGSSFDLWPYSSGKREFPFVHLESTFHTFASFWCSLYF
jgi:hypothetical protein